ncbi:glutamate racemase [Zymomonas mobilis]|uniref:glutamate racemase n=1 Tax=Zymomonas mobilis TaxID=542 RepID=UPI0021C4BDE8|nr:glutamate racemase [Zymomonas mobilis]MCP9307790.1 glutamate racemase [Zymomonas mobilis]
MAVSHPVLFFDSGVGGLSVLAAVKKALPEAPILYVADNGGFPYGTKSEEEIATRVPALLGRLVERYDPALLVIACNTASTIALPFIRSALQIPVVGTVPAIKPAALLSKSHVFGVLGTEATIRQPYVDHLSEEFASDCTVIRQGSANLVTLAEAKLRGEKSDLALYREELDRLLQQPEGDRIDVVVLACTHFPLVKEELEAVSPRPLLFIDGSEGIARRARYLADQLASKCELKSLWPVKPNEKHPPKGQLLYTAPTEILMPFRENIKKRGLNEIVFL